MINLTKINKIIWNNKNNLYSKKNYLSWSQTEFFRRALNSPELIFQQTLFRRALSNPVRQILVQHHTLKVPYRCFLNATSPRTLHNPNIRGICKIQAVMRPDFFADKRIQHKRVFSHSLAIKQYSSTSLKFAETWGTLCYGWNLSGICQTSIVWSIRSHPIHSRIWRKQQAFGLWRSLENQAIALSAGLGILCVCRNTGRRRLVSADQRWVVGVQQNTHSCSVLRTDLFIHAEGRKGLVVVETTVGVLVSCLPLVGDAV